MGSRILQNWITPRGNASSSVMSIAQGDAGWVDVDDAVDATFWIDCRNVTNPTGGNVTLNLETSPNKDEVSFMPVVAPIPLTASTTAITARTLLTPTTVPLSRWLRWRLSVGAGSAGQWDATIRLAMTTSAFSYFAPTQLAGCTLWLRSDQGITLNGTKVSAWADQSGQGNGASQGTSTNQMVYSSSGGAGGQASLAGSNSTYMLGSFASSFTLNTVVAVCSYTGGTATVPGAIASTNSSYTVNTAASLLYTPGTPAFTAREAVTGGNRDANLNGSLDSKAHVHLGTNDSSVTTYYRDGTLQIASSSFSGVKTSTNYVLGALDNTTTYTWVGAFYEFIAYNRVLQTAEIARLSRYLGARYGISTP
jgi:hypothetical protein